MRSGYTNLPSVTGAVNQGTIWRFLTKPWDDDTVRQEIRSAFGEYAKRDRRDHSAAAPQQEK